MAALGAQSIASSYEQLLHVDADGGGNSTTHVSVKDGDNGTTFGFTIATDALMMSSTNRLEFGDTGTYIHQSADGVLDLVSDTELELNATTIDINGAVEISGHTLIESTSQFRFGDTGTYIHQSADGVLDLVSDTEIELTATTIDINGATDLSGDLTLAGDIVFNAAGKGICLGVTSNTDANTLDDYEEGTWVGTFTDGTNDCTMHGTYRNGYYTKVGNIVHISGYFVTTSLGSASGDMWLKGLPFTCVNATAGYAGISVGQFGGSSVTAGHNLAARVDINTTILNLRLNDTTSGTSQLQSGELTATGEIIIAGSYRAA